MEGGADGVRAGDAPSIREARPEDAAAVAALSGELGYPISAEHAAEHIQDPRGVTLLVADRGDGVIGWIELAVRRTIEFGEAAEIQALVVAERERGRAVGSALLVAAERWARARRLPRIRVRSNVVRERTHGFYLERGYAERKRQVVFDKMLDEPVEQP
jgi:GNAT superfamily N-acetyltransferase